MHQADERAQGEMPSIAWASLSPRQLLKLYQLLMDQLRSLGVLRTSNNPVADYGEYLVARALNLQLTTSSTAGYDAISSGGLRYQVKARRLTEHNTSRQLSFMRGLEVDGGPFDWLIGILFDADFSVLRAAQIPIDVIRANSRHVQSVNGWRFVLHDRFWLESGVVDITEQLRRAANQPIAPRPQPTRASFRSAPSSRTPTRVAPASRQPRAALLARPLPDGLDHRAMIPKTLRDPTPEEAARGVEVAYSARSFVVYRAVVDRLAPYERFRIELPRDCYEFSRDQFETAFPRLIQTNSYRLGPPSTPGSAYYSISRVPPSAASPFRCE